MSGNAIAALVAFGAAVFAVAMAAAMLVLILRRYRQEEGVSLRQKEELQVLQCLIAATDGSGILPLDEVAPAVARDALAHCLMLIRGDDRAKLLALAERTGIMDQPMRQLRHRRPERRIDAIHMLERFASESCLAELERCLAEDPSADVRLEAAAALARLGRAPPPLILIASLNLEHAHCNRVHAALFRAAAERHPYELYAVAQRGEMGALQSLLVEALGWTADLGMAERLAEFATHPDFEVRAAAIRAARHLGHPGAGSWIIPLLDDPAEPVRVQAAQACGHLRLAEAVPALERHVAEPAWWVRTRVRFALDQLRPRRSSPLSLISRS